MWETVRRAAAAAAFVVGSSSDACVGVPTPALISAGHPTGVAAVEPSAKDNSSSGIPAPGAGNADVSARHEGPSPVDRGALRPNGHATGNGSLMGNIGGVLRPGGRLVFACWAPFAENRHRLISCDVALRHLGKLAPSLARQPGPLALAIPPIFADSHGRRVHRYRCRTGPSDDHWRQPRGGNPPGSGNGTDSKADRGREARRRNSPDDRPRDRGGVRRRSPIRLPATIFLVAARRPL